MLLSLFHVSDKSWEARDSYLTGLLTSFKLEDTHGVGLNQLPFYVEITFVIVTVYKISSSLSN